MNFSLGMILLFMASVTAGYAIESFIGGAAIFFGGLFYWVIQE